MEKIQLVIFIAAFVVALCLAIVLFSLSFIPGMIFLILLVVAILSVSFARPVIQVQVKATFKDERDKKQYTLNEVPAELDAEKGYITEIPLGEFLQQDEVTLHKKNGDPDGHTYDRSGTIRIRIEKKLFIYKSGSTGDDKYDPVTKYISFKPIPTAGNNKVTVFILTLISILAAFWFCKDLNQEYRERNDQIRMNLTANLDAISSGESIILAEDAEVEADAAYYSELPEVHLVVITKEQNIFYSEESAFFNPNIVNTVLMLYEDNLSGNLYHPEEDAPAEETTEAAPTAEVSYFDLTELYLNLPIVLEDGTEHMIGELLQGVVDYQGKTGYPAIRAWFRDIYHIRVASVTELPVSVISGCYGTEISMSVNLNADFIRFVKDNYCASLENDYASFSSKEMLLESRPSYTAKMQDDIQDMAYSLGLMDEKVHANNKMLMMSGIEIEAFGNSVRMSHGDGEGEYDILSLAGYYENKDSLPPLEEWQDKPKIIMHSNWDILLVDILDSISNMNNGTYQVLCEENHQELLQTIRTSDPEALERFMHALCNASTINEDEPEGTFIFSVRNLNLKLSTKIGETNVYLLNQPLEIKPYTNRQIKKFLYYCLRQPKGSKGSG